MNREELAWAAGFFDGEGCVCCGTRQGKYKCIRLMVGQIDTRALWRMCTALGSIGTIREGKRRKPSPLQKHIVWYYWVDGFEGVQAVVAMLWPWLGPVKRQQASNALKAFITYQKTLTRPLAHRLPRPIGKLHKEKVA